MSPLRFHGTAKVPLLAIAVIFLAALPAALGVLSAPANTTYNGLPPLSQGDYLVYIGYIQQTAEGAGLLYENIFASESHAAVVFNPLWAIPGLLSRVLPLAAEVSYHVIRLALVPLLLMLLWRFYGTLFQKEQDRILGMFIVLFAGGFGGIITLLFPDPYLIQWPHFLDVYAPESSVFLTMLQSPHFIAGTILFLAGMWLLMRGEQEKRLRYSISAGAAFGVLFLFHPYHLPGILVICAVFLMSESLLQGWSWRRVFRLTIPLLLAAPALLIHLYQFTNEPLVAATTARNITTMPPWPMLIGSYGLLLPLAVLGATTALRSQSLWQRLVVLWAAGQAAAFFLPMPFTRRLTQGFDIPLAVLATFGILWCLRWFSARNPGTRKQPALIGAGIVMAVVLASSTIFVLGRTMWDYQRQGNNPLLFYPDGFHELAEAFRARSNPDDIFLGDVTMSLYIASHTLRHAYMAHGAETPDFDRKRDEVELFFTKWDSVDRQQFLDEKQIRWVILESTNEQFVSVAASTPGVSEVFRTAAARLYSVDRSTLE